MDRAALTRRITTRRFSVARGGYDQSEVDTFLDSLVAALGGGDGAEEITAHIEVATFTPTRLRAGYSVEDVDALLDEVTACLGGTVSTGGTSAAERPDAPTRSAASGSGAAAQPSALIEPRKGLLARVFGR